MSKRLLCCLFGAMLFAGGTVHSRVPTVEEYSRAPTAEDGSWSSLSGRADVVSAAELNRDVAMTGTRIQLAQAGQAQPYIVSSRAGDPRKIPFKWAGLWQTQTGLNSYLTCTAQFVTPRVIVLAAHCVRDQDMGMLLS
jgi:hypothetical protein